MGLLSPNYNSKKVTSANQITNLQQHFSVRQNKLGVCENLSQHQNSVAQVSLEKINQKQGAFGTKSVQTQ